MFINHNHGPEKKMEDCKAIIKAIWGIEGDLSTPKVPKLHQPTRWLFYYTPTVPLPQMDTIQSSESGRCLHFIPQANDLCPLTFSLIRGFHLLRAFYAQSSDSYHLLRKKEGSISILSHK